MQHSMTYYTSMFRLLHDEEIPTTHSYLRPVIPAVGCIGNSSVLDDIVGKRTPISLTISSYI